MSVRLGTSLAVLAAMAVLLALPGVARAHNLFVSPRSAPLGSDFVFRGTLWQPLHRVRWLYDEFANGSFQRTGTFRAGSAGRFRFTWGGEDVAATHRMCFRQFDSRPNYRRTFLRCRRFTALEF
jgi:hypothetical protein